MYTKEMQTKKVKKTKTKSFGKKRTANDNERKYLKWLDTHRDKFKCFVCKSKGSIEWHHVKEFSSDKKNHFQLIPLCGEKCHRLGEFSAHGNPRWFRSNFPIEDQRAYADKIFIQYLK